MLTTRLQTTGIVSGKQLYRHYKELYSKFFGGLTVENLTLNSVLTNTKLQGSGQQLVVFTYYISAAEYAAQTAASGTIPWRVIGLPKISAVYTPLYLSVHCSDVGTKTTAITLKHGDYNTATWTAGTASGATACTLDDANSSEYTMQTQQISGSGGTTIGTSFTTSAFTQQVLGLFITTRNVTALSSVATEHMVITYVCKVAMI